MEEPNASKFMKRNNNNLTVLCSQLRTFKVRFGVGADSRVHAHDGQMMTHEPNIRSAEIELKTYIGRIQARITFGWWIFYVHACPYKPPIYLVHSTSLARLVGILLRVGLI